MVMFVSTRTGIGIESSKIGQIEVLKKSEGGYTALMVARSGKPIVMIESWDDEADARQASRLGVALVYAPQNQLGLAGAPGRSIA